MKSIITYSLIAALLFSGCSKSTEVDTSSISTDSTTIALGRLKFSQNCSTCHNFSVDGMGPQLGGLTQSVSSDWIIDFIKDPKAKIESGDTRAKEIYDKFKTQMPGFNSLADDDMNAIVAYIHTKKAPDPRKSNMDPNAIKDPFPEPIPMSDLVVNLELFTQIPPSSEQNPLTRITKFDSPPGSNELFVVDLNGKLYHLNGKKPEVYLDLTTLIPNLKIKPGHANGFGSFAFHPEFAKNGLLYTTHSETSKSAKADFDYADSIRVELQWVLSEWKTNQPNKIPFVGKRRELFRINMMSQMHGVQEIAFNPLAKKGSDDYGLLYIGIGDGGSAETGVGFLCHSPEKIWGTVLRIDPSGNNSANGKYGIPNSNPFTKTNNERVQKEIYAYGFRNPHRMTWSRTGQLFVSNIGQHAVEALYQVQPGNDCGWPIREGSFLIDDSQNMHNIYPLPADDAKNNLTYPIAEYDHDEGNAIAGGFEYWGSIPELQGKFVFGDIVHGRLFYIEMKDVKLGSRAPIKEWRVSLDGKIQTLKELTGADKVDERFGRDSKGELYLTTKPDGKVYKLVSASIN